MTGLMCIERHSKEVEHWKSKLKSRAVKIYTMP